MLQAYSFLVDNLNSYSLHELRDKLAKEHTDNLSATLTRGNLVVRGEGWAIHTDGKNVRTIQAS